LVRGGSWLVPDGRLHHLLVSVAMTQPDTSYSSGHWIQTQSARLVYSDEFGGRLLFYSLKRDEPHKLLLSLPMTQGVLDWLRQLLEMAE
jgi:hypothetical protein